MSNSFLSRLEESQTRIDGTSSFTEIVKSLMGQPQPQQPKIDPTAFVVTSSGQIAPAPTSSASGETATKVE